MDITRFINSKDIAAHFKAAFHEEDYPDLVLRYAWLIWQSRCTSIEEKHQAWQEIIDSFPDMDIPENADDRMSDSSLHRFLARYMELEKDLLTMMYTAEAQTAYQIRLRTRDPNLELWIWRTDHTLYSDYRSCIDSCKKDASEVLGIVIEKQWLADGKRLTLLLAPDGTPLQIEASKELIPGDETLCRVFSNMHFSFPLPFQKGDIVSLLDAYSQDSSMSNPHVFDWLCTRPDGVGKANAYTYSLCRNGDIVFESVDRYMDLVFYHRELKGAERMLVPLSNYSKGEIGLNVLLNACYLLRIKAYGDKLRGFLNCTQEELKLCGLAPTQEVHETDTSALV